MIIARRGFLTGLGSLLIAAPAIVRAASIMPVKAMPISLARHPLYDSDSWQALRENFFRSIDPPLYPWQERALGIGPKMSEIMAQNELRRGRRSVYLPIGSWGS